MTWTITDIDHTALTNTYGNVSITLNEDTHINLTMTGDETMISRTKGMLATNRVTDYDIIKSIIEDVSSELPDDVERTARRILQLDAWLNEQDIEYEENYSVRVHGRYRPLRSNQKLILMLTVTTRETYHEPVVILFDEDADEEYAHQRCDEIVETLVKRRMGAMLRSHYEDSGETIRAGECIQVESLLEVESIVTGEVDDSRQMSQSALISF